MESLTPHDALIIPDIQNNFLPGGVLGISDRQDILPVLLTYIERFHAHCLSKFLTHDWHPPTHCSCRHQSEPWPTHCVAGTSDSLPPSNFDVPGSAVTIYTTINPDRGARSVFRHIRLNHHLLRLLKMAPTFPVLIFQALQDLAQTVDRSLSHHEGEMI